MLKKHEVIPIIRRALEEDRATADITTRILVPRHHHSRAEILVKEEAVVAGIGIARYVFEMIDSSIKFQKRIKDGHKAQKGTVLAVLQGKTVSLLKGERTALNFLGHLSGIATKTSCFVEKVKPYRARIFDTRKTIPNLRALEKYAVVCGGGYNHRFNLSDMILIKDNHRTACRPTLSLTEMIRKVKRSTSKPVEVEVENLKEFDEVMKASPEIILLDNMNLREIKECVRRRKFFKAGRKPQLEVSGGVRIETVRRIAQTGVDRISVGELTHSVRAIDVSLELVN